MARKNRKTVTEELRNLVLRLADDEERTTREISEMVDLNRKTVSNIIYKNENDINVQVRGRRNDIPRHEDQVIKNIIACNNDLTLNEISNELYVRTNIKLSVPTISRRLKKLGISRKRLSLIPV
jgi:transposase